MSAISKPPMFLNMPLITDTRVNSLGVIPMKHMEGLLDNTMGSSGERVLTNGIVTDTTRGIKSSSHIPVIRTKTNPKRMGQIPYAGKQY